MSAPLPTDAPDPKSTAAEQQIYLSPEGFVLESCDTLFPAAALRGAALVRVFPVLESCWASLFRPDDAAFGEFALPGVHLDFPSGASGIFDFQFLKIWLGQREAVFWHIAERTDFYQKKQAEQQRRNEGALRARLTRQNAASPAL